MANQIQVKLKSSMGQIIDFLLDGEVKEPNTPFQLFTYSGKIDGGMDVCFTTSL